MGTSRERKIACPLCNKSYNKKNRRTFHHVFPLVFYRGSKNVKVEVCETCHQREFNYLYPMRDVWSKKTCVDNWIAFCRSKGKNALEIYPDLLREVVG